MTSLTRLQQARDSVVSPLRTVVGDCHLENKHLYVARARDATIRSNAKSCTPARFTAIAPRSGVDRRPPRRVL
jgi:hypothetical protein